MPLPPARFRRPRCAPDHSGNRQCAGGRDRLRSTPKPPTRSAYSWTFQPMNGGGTVVLVEDITERRSAEARIIHLARYDELTGLPNRGNFRDEIERLLTIAQARGDMRPSALLFVDLDQFKQVNDTLGHPSGDRLLCEVALRLQELLSQDDIVARFGGDEFVVFQQHIDSHEDAAVLARRIVDRLSERYIIEQHVVEIGASVGIADDLARHQSRCAAEKCRYGAVPCQGRRPRHLLLLPRGNGEVRRSAPHSRA
ncbi:MAG: GGDEF domain-containing protein [Rhodopseudomonas palustris]|nr:GGDEF domain-containing protein [Rhodopseudomonas palustris]